MQRWNHREHGEDCNTAGGRWPLKTNTVNRQTDPPCRAVFSKPKREFRWILRFDCWGRIWAGDMKPKKIWIHRRVFLMGWLLVFLAATPWLREVRAAADASDGTDPVADPRAVVTVGHARITILTPQLIRMEWAADGKFEDHASLVFLNRRLPVPTFTQEKQSTGGGTGTLLIQTSALALRYRDDGSGGKFSAGNLSITLRLNGR